MTNNFCNIESEQSVIGGLMMTCDTDKVEKVTAIIKPESFYHPRHGLLYSTITHLLGVGVKPDLVTVTDRLESLGKIEEVGGFAYVASIVSKTPSAANMTSYAYSVRSNYQKRALISLMTNCLELVSTPSEEPIKKQVDGVYSMIEGYTESYSSIKAGELVPMKEIMANVLDLMEERNKTGINGITTGITELDKLIGKKMISNTALFVIGARPKCGKTSFITKILEHVALDLDKSCAMFTLEMSNNEIGEKMLSQVSGVDGNEFYDQAGMSDYVLAKTFEGVKRLSTDKIMVSDKPSQSLRDIVNQSRKLKRQRGEIGMVAVDYLTLMDAGKSERNDLGYGAITKGLKNLAKELGCPVFLLTQLNRNLEARPDKRPKPSDSRDTGQIEQDCDYWVGLYRDEIYNEDSPNKGFLEIGLELNRHGDTGRALARMEKGRISNLMENDSFTEKEDQKQKGTFNKGF